MRISQDGALGAVCIIFGLILIFIWIPLDVESGIIEKVRSRKVIGDAMAPTIAAVLLILSGALLLFTNKKSTVSNSLSLTNLRYGAILIVGAFVTFFIMRWTGPVVVWFGKGLGADIENYRVLRDTAPWKYLGFVGGGTFAVFLLSSFADRSFRLTRLVISFAVCVMVALFYGVPFEDLLLPPNGDV